MSTLSSLEKSNLHPSPGVPSPATDTEIPEVLKDIWILYYTVGGNPHPVFKFFKYAGSLQETVERCRGYCRIMGYRQLFVTPLFIDMDKDEYTRMNPGR